MRSSDIGNVALPARAAAAEVQRGGKPWEIDHGLWERVEPLLPMVGRCLRSPGRRLLDDRRVLCGILFVLHTGIPWRHLPQELGFGSGTTCWRRRSLAAPARVAAGRHAGPVSGVGRLEACAGGEGWLRALSPIRGKRCQPLRRPKHLRADRGYDHESYRDQVRRFEMIRASPDVAPNVAPASAYTAGGREAIARAEAHPPSPAGAGRDPCRPIGMGLHGPRAALMSSVHRAGSREGLRRRGFSRERAAGSRGNSRAPRWRSGCRGAGTFRHPPRVRAGRRSAGCWGHRIVRGR
ncbi:hypothetical protein STBA_02990 [Streptomyces sp. MP131-18]|nr:hypothetical protein STBA_02990 [Streptomyces sp. MP131-18]